MFNQIVSPYKMLLSLLIGSFSVAFLLSRTLNWLALTSWRRSIGRHWTERTRLLYPAVISAHLNDWLISINVGVLSYTFLPERVFLLATVSAFLGSRLAGFFLAREIYPSLRFKLWVHLVAAGLFLFSVRWFLLILAIFEMPPDWSITTWLIAACLFILWVAFHFGLGFVLLRWFRLLQPATEHLNALVAEVSQKMNVPVRATWILSTFIGNAAAFPQIRQLVFTDKLLATLSDEETKAICAHELGHLSEPRTVLVARTLTAFSFYPLIFARPLYSFGDNGVGIYDLFIIGFLIVLAFGRRVARRMEQRADKIAIENQLDGAVYARALARLYEMNHTPAVMQNANKVHPDLYDRMVAAGVTPDFPKPARAKRQSWTSLLMLFCLIATVLLILFVKA